MKKPWLPPVLVSTWYIISRVIYGISYNSMWETLLFLSVILLFSTCTYLIMIKLLKNTETASILTTLFLFLNYFFDYLVKQINDKIIATHTDIPYLDYIFLFFFLLFLVILFFRLKKSQKSHERIITLFSAILISLCTYQLYSVIIRVIKDTSPEKEIAVLPISKSNDLPDIYFIICDSYTSNKSLKNYWTYDNNTFSGFLKDKKFNITDSSTTKFSSTPNCIASYLNMAWLPFPDTDRKTDAYAIAKIIRENVVCKILQTADYEIINISNFDLADQKKRYEFYDFTVLFANTLWNNLYIHFKMNCNTKESMPILNISLARETAAIDHGNKPRFIYTHFMMPHSPFFFVPENRLKSEYNTKKEVHFLEQVKLTNMILKNMITKIIEKNPSCIIILQGDHGFRALESRDVKDKDIEAHSILNSIYIQGKHINDSILNNPVNNFRLVFNEITNSDIPYEK